MATTKRGAAVDIRRDCWGVGSGWHPGLGGVHMTWAPVICAVLIQVELVSEEAWIKVSHSARQME